MSPEELANILDTSLKDTEGLYIPSHQHPEKYVAGAISSITKSRCKPFELSAEVMEPGFSGKQLGDIITGYCVANSEGYWLVYQPAKKIFYCFWGSNKDNLGAHGVIGKALECWLQ